LEEDIHNILAKREQDEFKIQSKKLIKFLALCIICKPLHRKKVSKFLMFYTESQVTGATNFHNWSPSKCMYVCVYYNTLTVCLIEQTDEKTLLNKLQNQILSSNKQTGVAVCTQEVPGLNLSQVISNPD
jgi:hypothetical protein